MERTRAPSSDRDEADDAAVGGWRWSVNEGCDCRREGSGPVGPHLRSSLIGLSLHDSRPDQGEHSNEDKYEDEDEEKHLEVLKLLKRRRGERREHCGGGRLSTANLGFRFRSRIFHPID